MRGNSATVVLHHSMVKLPEKPMMPRLFDERVGYFTTQHDGLHAQTSTRRERTRYIARWRLEKKDPTRRHLRAREADRLLHRFRDARPSGCRG